MVEDRSTRRLFLAAPVADRPPRKASQYPVIESMDTREDVEYCRALVEARGMEFLVLDQTRRDIGMPVVRVIIPGMRHFWARFASGRLYDVPVAMGCREHPLAEADLNPHLSSREETIWVLTRHSHLPKTVSPKRAAPCVNCLRTFGTGFRRFLSEIRNWGCILECAGRLPITMGALPFGFELPLHARRPKADFGVSLASGTRTAAFFRERARTDRTMTPQGRSRGCSGKWILNTRLCVKSSVAS